MKSRPTRVVFIGQAKTEMELLNEIAGEQIAKGVQNSEEIRLLKSINQKTELIKSNPLFGNNISKRLIPKQLSVTNLFRIELTGYWRMLYTLKGDEIEVVAIVLYLIDHKKYNKLFGYKND